MSSKSATTDPRAFCLSFALAACSRSFFCNFSSYVSGASPAGSLGAKVKVTSTCIAMRAENRRHVWRADSAQCPGLSGADSAQCTAGWVPSDLLQPGLTPPGSAKPATRAAGRALRRRSGRARPSQGGASATSHGPKATLSHGPKDTQGRAPPTSMEPWVESGIVSGVATPGVQFLSRASPGWREGWGSG